MTRQTNKVLKHPAHVTVKNAQKKHLANAVYAIQKANRALSLSQAAKRFDVPKSPLSTRLHGVQDQILYGRSLQRLTSEEKNSLIGWILQLQA